MTTTLPNSYTTNQIYQAFPQFVQDQDAQNNYALWWWVYGVCQNLDTIDTLMFDNVGAGVTVTPTQVGATPITQAKLSASIGPSDTSITVFNTDSTWNQVNTSASFTAMIEDEEVLIPSGTYNWLLPSLTISGLTRGYNGTTAASHSASAGADGTIDLDRYASAPGWSQIVDIDRCPEYALPWLAQFVGAAIPQNNTLTYEQTIQKIKSRSGFQRSTPASIQAEMAAAINSGNVSSPILPSQVILLENTALLAPRGANLNAALSNSATSLTLLNTDSSWGSLGSNSNFVLEIDTEKILVPQGSYAWSSSPVTLTGVTRGYDSTSAAAHLDGANVSLAGGNNIYGYDEYAMTVLIPAIYYGLYTYSSLVTAAGGAGTYAAVNSFIGTLGGLYGDLSASPFPISDSQFTSFIYRYRPAGIQVFVGGY
jgi:hypothetical protein